MSSEQLNNTSLKEIAQHTWAMYGSATQHHPSTSTTLDCQKHDMQQTAQWHPPTTLDCPAHDQRMAHWHPSMAQWRPSSTWACPAHDNQEMSLWHPFMALWHLFNISLPSTWQPANGSVTPFDGLVTPLYNIRLPSTWWPANSSVTPFNGSVTPL